MRKFYYVIICMVCLLSVSAQKKVLLEQFRTFSMIGPVMQYLNQEETKAVLLKQLNNSLLKYKNAQLIDQDFRMTVLPELKPTNPTDLPFTIADSSTWHMYLDLYEFETNTFYYVHPEYKEDSALFKRTASVFDLTVLLTDWKKDIILKEFITICITRGSSNGFGIQASSPSLSNRGFTDMLNYALERVLDPENKVGLMEIKAAPVFYADNFLLPIISNYPVIQVSNKNNIASYKRDQTDEIIRLGEPFYEELITKGKNKNVVDKSIISTAINNTGRQNSSDFVHARQETRDVLRDKNYTLKMLIEINPIFNYKNEDEVFTGFMPDSLHFLLKDQDTIAKFKIIKNTGLVVGDKLVLKTKNIGLGAENRTIYLNKLSNGYDSTSIYLMDPAEVSRKIFSEYVITGLIHNQPFTIMCSNRNTLKEFYLNQDNIAVAMGKFLPERIAVFDASLDKEILNQLMMIGFSRLLR